MDSVVFSKDDDVVNTDSIRLQNPVYVNTKVETTTERNEDYEILRKVENKPSGGESPGRLTQRIWQQLQDKAVLILFALQGLTIIAMVAMGVTLSRSGYDALNGGWTTWATWEQCSATCGIGLERRERTCTHPEPKSGGKYCVGESSTYRMCNATECNQALNGGWTNWAEWGECSATCGTGLQIRRRTCYNPEPKYGGKTCEGEPFAYEICTVTACTNAVGFTAYYAHELSDDGFRRLKFSRTTYISDDSFNITSSVFTCEAPGLYVFTATLTRLSGTNSSYSCHFYVNGVNTLYIYTRDYDNVIYRYSYPSVSGTVVVKLRKYDTVFLGSCGDVTYLHRYATSFSGFLVTEDNE